MRLGKLNSPNEQSVSSGEIGLGMVNLNMNTFGKLGMASVLGLTALSLGACSTTSGVIAQGAPISYKADQGRLQQVSVERPYTSLMNTGRATPRAYSPAARPVAPRTTVPQTRKPLANALPTQPRASKFDQASVDTDLYKHQRVGKRYTIMGKSYTPKHQPHYDVTGVASWYGDKFHGRPTATGELYDMDDITAAHKTLPLNSMVYVTNLETGKGMLVRVNDRGPFVDDRIIDLSRATARKLGMFNSGLGRVRVQYAGPADPMAAKTNKKPTKRPSTKALRKKDKPKQVAQLPKMKDRLQKLLPKRVPQTLPKLTPNYKPLRDLGKAAKAALPEIKAPTRMAPKVQAPVVQAPQLQSPQVQPQRRAQVQQPQYPFQPTQEYVNPLLGETTQNPLAQSMESLTAPEQSAQTLQNPGVSLDNGPVTLTIKGPVHMATSKADGTQAEPKFIPAVNYTKKPAVK